MSPSLSLPFVRAALAAKLAPPATSRTHLPRAQLVERICSAPARSVVVVRAPAGFGKTTLMAQCLRRLQAQGTRTAWLTLDPSDNDPSRLLACLAAAIEPLTHPASAGHPQRLGPDPAGPALLIDLLERLTRATAPCALFLDEVETIHEPPVLALLAELMERLPPLARLVLGSRVPPAATTAPPPHGTPSLIEMTPQALRFSLDETALYMALHRQIDLASEDVQRLHQRTEGWPVALWLASLALERQDDHRRFIEKFSGSHALLTDYLTESVLARQPSRVRDFLLRTSILRHLTAPLCEALMPGIDGAALLGELASADILLSPVEGEQRTYRYHSLFADFLQAQLQRELAPEIPRLHRAASAWYARARLPVPAIEHALAGDDPARALALLQRHAPQLLAQGRLRLLARHAGKLPAAMLASHPRLQAQYLWAVAYTQGATAAETMMAGFGIEHTQDPELRAFMLPLRPLLLAMQDRMAEALEVSQACIKQLPTPSRFADSVLLCTAASLHLALGDVAQARLQLQAVQTIGGQPRTAFVVMFAEMTEGLIDWREGRLRQARRRTRAAVAATQRTGRSEPTGNAWAGVHHAFMLYEGNDLQAAEQLMRAYVPLVRDLGLADLMILSHSVLARLALQHGDTDRALQTLVDLEYLGLERGLHRVVGSALLERARILLLQQQWRAAQEALNSAGDPSLWQGTAGQYLIANEIEDLVLARLRMAVATGHAADSLPKIEQALAEARAAGRQTRALKLELLQAMALAQTRPVRASHRVLAQLLQRTGREGFVRLLVDEGPLAGQLLRGFTEARAVRATTRRNTPLDLYLQQLLAAFGLSPPLRQEPAPLPRHIERLTPREVAVLRLVADGYSDAELAQKLFVSPSTVRTHLRNLYDKLDVRNRLQAVAAARRAHMI